MRRSRFAALPASLLVSAVLAAPTARAVAFLQGVTQSCFTSVDCETAPPVFGAGNLAQISRSYGGSDGFSYATSASMSLDYVGFAGSAVASGLENPTSPPTPPVFSSSQSYSGRSFGNLFDTVTAGEGGAPGFLRLPLHIVGGGSVSWQNGLGSTQLAITCTSNEVGAFVPLGPCTGASFTFTEDEALDTVVDVDVPILLGVPVELRVSATITAITGHAFGSAIPFTGRAEASFATLPFTGAVVLDANRDPIPGAIVSAAESGFSYAPEPEAGAGALAAFAALAVRRMRAARAGCSAVSGNGEPSPGSSRPVGAGARLPSASRSSARASNDRA